MGRTMYSFYRVPISSSRRLLYSTTLKTTLCIYVPLVQSNVLATNYCLLGKIFSAQILKT